MGGFDGLNPVFADRLKQLINASGGLLGPGSGKRSVEEQIALRKSNGCPDVWSSPASSCRIPTAIPGRSNHNHGLAMDLVDSTTGRAVQGGSKADAWLAANAGRFGFHRPVKDEAWHMELVDDAELAKHGGGPGGPGGGQVGPNGEPVSINKNWMEEKRKPEDELSHRLDTIMGMLTQKSPEADTPAEMTDPGLAQDLTVLAGGPPEVKPGSGGGPPPGPGPSGGGGGDIKSIVKNMAAQMGWGEDQWPALERLVQKESSWNPRADNPTSTAYGLFQFLDSTWKNYGGKTDDPAGQAKAGLAYVKDRYGSPQAALAFHEKNNWY